MLRLLLRCRYTQPFAWGSLAEMSSAFRLRPLIPSRQQSCNDVRRSGAGKLLIQPLKFERESIVVDSKTMQNRSVEVPHMHRIFDDVIAVVICFAKSDSGSHSTPCHPRRVAARMVITPVVFGGQ